MYKDIIRNLLITIVSILLWESREKDKNITSYWYIYPTDINFKDDRLTGQKRISILFLVEDES